MPNITSYEENANKNHNEMFHPSKNSYHQRDKRKQMLATIWEKRILHTVDGF
jgi:hypothetical protein